MVTPFQTPTATFTPCPCFWRNLTRSVIGAFYAVHRALGFGFLEHVHAAALEFELAHRGHRVIRELDVVVQYAGIAIAHQRLDMIVDDKVVLEIKSTERLHRDAKRQLYNYLRATRLEVGLLLHFGRSANFYRVICTNRGGAPRIGSGAE